MILLRRLGLVAGLALLVPLAAARAGAPSVPASAARVELGRRLFYDADLSADGTMACATCHEQKHAFADGNTTHPGVTGQPGRRNVPGLANVGRFSPLTFADARVRTLEAQVAVPVLGTHPVEMGMKGQEAEISRRLGRDPCYRAMFARAFPGDGRVNLPHVARALASFERTFVSRGSAYDRHVLGEPARAGQALFHRDCAACHAGDLFTDLRFHQLAPADPGAADQGLFEATGKAADRGAFRTPSLRNVALTGPWWHDGSARTLAGAIARHGRAYTAEQTADLLAFLEGFSDPGFTHDPALGLPATACGAAL